MFEDAAGKGAGANGKRKRGDDGANGTGAPSALPADTRTVAVYARGGNFYAQRLEDAGLELSNGCRQSAFFHFQEWKKAWVGPGGYGPLFGVEPLGEPPRYSARPRNFTISAAEGIALLRLA